MGSGVGNNPEPGPGGGMTVLLQCIHRETRLHIDGVGRVFFTDRFSSSGFQNRFLCRVKSAAVALFFVDNSFDSGQQFFLGPVVSGGTCSGNSLCQESIASVQFCCQPPGCSGKNKGMAENFPGQLV